MLRLCPLWQSCLLPVLALPETLNGLARPCLHVCSCKRCMTYRTKHASNQWPLCHRHYPEPCHLQKYSSKVLQFPLRLSHIGKHASGGAFAALSMDHIRTLALHGTVSKLWRSRSPCGEVLEDILMPYTCRSSRQKCLAFRRAGSS